MEREIRDGSTAERTARHIEALIREGSLRPGEALRPERELAERLEVSRPTLRQAIRLLEARGLIAAGPGGGRQVAPIGAGLTDPLIGLLTGDAGQGVVADYLEFRATAERMAAMLAAERATEVDRAHLADCMAEVEAAHRAGDHRREAEADVALHVAVYEASHNLVLLHVMRALSGLLRQGVIASREKLFARPETQAPLLAQHRAIHDAVMTRDAVAAGQAAEAHIHYTRAALAEIDAAEARLELSLRRIDGGRLGARRGGGEG